MKRSYKILILVVAAIVILVLLKLANDNFNQQQVSKVIIRIDTQNGPGMITEDEMYTLVSQGYNSLTQQKVGDIDLGGIENLARTNPYVLSVDAYINMDASLSIDIKQRKPVVRVFNFKGESYYIDADGQLLPLHEGYATDLVVAAGIIGDPYRPSTKLSYYDSVSYDQCKSLSTLNKVYIIAKAIDGDSLLRKMITQIYAVDNTHFELIPIIGTQNILIGDVDGLETKLRNLHHFYKEGYNNINFEQYKTFDLRFHNQVVCIKKPTI